MAEYSFLTTWLLDSPREPVWEAIYDQERWPAWWRGVEEVEERNGGDGGGVERPMLLEADAVGELAGVGRWRLFEQEGTTAVLYEWNVATTKPWMNLVAPVARPIFEWNHDWVMARGGEGIARLLGCELLARH
jgi:hypothetical protein